MKPSLKTRRIEVTTSAGIYAAGDQIGSLLTIPKVPDSRCSKLVSIAVLDKAKQKSLLNIHFFSKAPTVASTDNATLDITDAQMADKYLGTVAIPAASYVDLSGSSVVSVNNIQMILLSQDQEIPGKYKGDNLYAIVESGGTPTYGSAATNLQLILGFEA